MVPSGFENVGAPPLPPLPPLPPSELVVVSPPVVAPPLPPLVFPSTVELSVVVEPPVPPTPVVTPPPVELVELVAVTETMPIVAVELPALEALVFVAPVAALGVPESTLADVASLSSPVDLAAGSPLQFVRPSSSRQRGIQCCSSSMFSHPGQARSRRPPVLVD